MSDRYTWAVDGHIGRGGQAAERREWSLQQSALPEASEVPAVPDGTGGPAPGASSGAGRTAPLRAAPTSDVGLWQPLGPATMLRGFVDSDVRVAGRVRDIAVSPDGTRAYAASALGGLWYSGDSGATWEPVGAWRTSNPATVAASSNTLTAGAVHVVWGADESADEVWLGTGEAVAGGRRDSGYVGIYGGVGVLHATGPVAKARADPLVDPWEPPQAQPRPPPAGAARYHGLLGEGVFRIAENPALARDLLMATTDGLHRHDPAAPAGTEWSLVVVPAWEKVLLGVSGVVEVTDVAWTPATGGPGGHGARIWVTVAEQGGLGLAGLWLSTDNGATFAQVALPAMPASVPRFVIGWHRQHADVLYVLCTGPTLWRIDGTLAPPGAAPVTGLPATLFGPRDISDYAIAAGVDPANSARVIVGGASVPSPIDLARAGGGSHVASMYRLTVSPGAAPGTFVTDYAMPANAGASDPTWVGSEVHADVHRIVWESSGGVSQVWVATDGGVSRSTLAGALGTFAAASSGLAVAEVGFLANHPTSPGPILAGLQDSGTQLRIGEAVWRQAIRNGDSGGVAFDPGDPGRFVAQTIRSRWSDDVDASLTPTRRSTNQAAGSPFADEDKASAFYSYAAVTRTTGAGAVTRLAVGTDRVWFSEKWGASHWDGTVYRREWVTLPTATDPRSGDAAAPAAPNALLQDQLPPGPLPWTLTTSTSRSGIRVLRWRSPTVLLAVTVGAVHSLTHPGAPGAWALAQVATRAAVPVGGPPVLVPVPTAGPNLPAYGAYNDLADDPTVAGAFYLATSHPLEPLWWWDGATCHPTDLGTVPPGTRSPAYSVVVDPATPTVVYVGTTVGVWKGTLTPPAGGTPPKWAWAPFSNGLPEAAVQDLGIAVYPEPVGGSLRLLRAALQARGVWEVNLDGAAGQRTYVRAHFYDTRRLFPTPMENPLLTAGDQRRNWQLDWAYERNRDHRTGSAAPRAHPDGTAVGNLLWHASPDIWCRPAPIPAAAPGLLPLPPALPWLTAPTDRFWLWSLQTALRALPPAQFPDAPLVVPDGRWTEWWVRRLRAIRTAFVPALPNPAVATAGRVDAELWNETQVQAAFWTAPWSTPEPSEADLAERVVGIATPRVGSLNGQASHAASTGVLRRRYVVDVCVHQRGRLPAASGDVAVVLLRTVLPAAATAWGAVQLPETAGLPAALDALPADTSAGPPPGALPGYVPPAGWAFVDTGRPARRPRRDVLAGEPRVVSFDADFSTDPPDTDVLLVALVHHRTEPVTISVGEVRSEILLSSQITARSVRTLL